jgi:eukaryotic-like serine/threonine-protein kinase
MAQHTPASNVIYPANVSRLRRVWTYTTGDAIASSSLVADEVIYVGSQDHTLYALSAQEGEKLWSYTTGDSILSSPTVAEGVVFVGSNDHSLYAFNQIYSSSGEKRQ